MGTHTYTEQRANVRLRDVQVILVPTDLHEHSRLALDYAHDLVDVLRAKLVVLHVTEPVPVSPMVEPTLGGGFVSAQPSIAGLRQFVGAVSERVFLEERVGGPVQEIVEAAEEHRADFIVMTTRGRTGLSRALHGSVAERVVRLAPCPVLVLHSGPQLSPWRRAVRTALHEPLLSR